MSSNVEINNVCYHFFSLTVILNIIIFLKYYLFNILSRSCFVYPLRFSLYLLFSYYVSAKTADQVSLIIITIIIIIIIIITIIVIIVITIIIIIIIN